MLQHALSKICLYDADTQHCVMRELSTQTVWWWIFTFCVNGIRTYKFHRTADCDNEDCVIKKDSASQLILCQYWLKKADCNFKSGVWWQRSMILPSICFLVCRHISSCMSELVIELSTYNTRDIEWTWGYRCVVKCLLKVNNILDC